MGKFSRLGHALYTGEKSIDFVGRRRVWYAMSGLIIIIAALGLQVRGINLGIEFVGGSEYRVNLPTSQVNQDTADKLQTAVGELGIPNADQPTVTTSGDRSVLVQVESLTPAESEKVVAAIVAATGVDAAADVSQSDIGPSWGKQVAQRSLIGLVVFLVLVMLFIWAYFREWKMSFAAIVALIHDLIITVGIYAWSNFEVTPATVTGLLTILGFSLYDTVVVFDKVRENTKSLRRTHKTYAAAANLAVNQTLVRSINTSLVALIPVGAILYVGVTQLGSGPLKDLALALFVGMASGAYSSIFIATPLLAHMKSTEKDIQESDRRAKARQRRDADRYANVPAFVEDMPIYAEPGGAATAVDVEDADEPVDTPAPPVTRRQPPTGKGRVAPQAHGEVKQSGSAGRAQPSRAPRAKRGKK
ncbi:MAG: protein translocase subunit SecF [Nocardioidaceae bacterium]|nr:protein translocase subunit SecF [Nocardioidaceae bacterium]